ncbi:MAG: hypothetical protein A2W90_11405 [Bacteroidetes bacterium GWF2_42_66]|nr:MAG: hypothetical protein A2W89_23165 [Bacteroidetes bacterium GWE2_42_39]OFY44888.1 MAG: hypothetical protein A2W90_11405 [Bacteroidetes bacterium GWF2_42_66]HBL76016.1 hypothetical protein [Prolixibacteraceae bacterium]HCR89642.1 hypothetical protein [Prolixibacteraceae bacterium]HCU62132.1 hypothetical protein [Prolixibacteraceae bacterium]
MNYLQIAFDIIILFLGIYIAFGKSYFSEKGKNLATKEDIGLITKEIETVKNEISFAVQRKNEFLREKKGIALTFNDDASFFIDYSSKVLDVLANNAKNLDLILKQTEDIRFQGAKVISTFLKIFVYFEDSSFRKSAENYYNATVKIQQLSISLLFQLEQFAIKESVMIDSFKNGQFQLKDELFSLTKNRKKIIEDYIIERKRLLDNEVYKLRGIYISELSDIIKNQNL